MLRQSIYLLVSSVLFLCVHKITEVGCYAPYMEPPCAQTGGQCLPADECPQGLLSDVRGLCPKQQSAGIECCYGVSIKEHRCSRRGGRCLLKTSCNIQLVDKRATDCKSSEVCCILV